MGIFNKHYLILVIFVCGSFNLIGCGKKDYPYKTEDIYNDLRKRVLELDPNTLGFSQSESDSNVWGLLMETGYPEAIATLVVVWDGAISLYFSNGGGIIGLGEHEKPRDISEQLLKLAPSFSSHFEATNSYPLPKRGYTRFYLLTTNGILTREVKEKDLGHNKHQLSPLFHKAHELITEIMIVKKTLSDK